jgi:anti-sigma factor RsiW
MMLHIDDDRLQDYVDGSLGEADRAQVERHLGACVACFNVVRDLRVLLQDVSALPRGIEPARDLRPGIHAAIDRQAAGKLAGRSVWSARYVLAAAAVILVVLSSTLTALLVQGRAGDGVSLVSAWPDVADRFHAIEANYVAATDELERTLQEQRAELAPETVRLLEENLRIIDRALAEASAALRFDPNNQALSDMLVAAYEKKLDLLRRAAQPAPMRGGV